MTQVTSFNLQLPVGRIVIDGTGTKQTLRLIPSNRDEAIKREATYKRLRRILRARRARADFFDGDLFADPAWDIILELYACELAHRRMSVSDVCIASAVPATTALRWIRTLEHRGLVERRQDPHDGRRLFVQLSDAGSSAVKDYFSNVPGEADHVL